MVSTNLTTKSLFHARSNSLPSRTHPTFSQIDEHLCRLKAIGFTSSSISNDINGLADLYELVNNLLLLPNTQQALAQEFNEKQIDEALDRSLRLVDACGTMRDALLQIKEGTQELQSVIRRRRVDESRLTFEGAEYLNSRKKSNKLIHKSLKYLKSTSAFSSLDNESMAIISLLREVEGVTLTVFESVASYTSVTKANLKPRGWHLVSKLIGKKHLERENETAQTSKFEKADAALYALISHKTGKSDKSVQNAVLKTLEDAESSIQDLEEGLEFLLRRLIKIRVSLLNIINH